MSLLAVSYVKADERNEEWMTALETSYIVTRWHHSRYCTMYGIHYSWCRRYRGKDSAKAWISSYADAHESRQAKLRCAVIGWDAYQPAGNGNRVLEYLTLARNGSKMSWLRGRLSADFHSRHYLKSLWLMPCRIILQFHIAIIVTS